MANVDLVAKKSREILAIDQVEPCLTLRTQLQELVSAHSTTSENQLIHVGAKAHLEDGVRLHKILFGSLEKAETTMDSAIKTNKPY